MFNLYKNNRDRIFKIPAISIPANSITILKNPEHFHQELLHQIAKASNRIYLTALYLQDDETGREILDAIYQRLEVCPQLQVIILVDFHRAQRGLIGKGKQQGNNLMYREYALRYPNRKVRYLGVPIKSKEMFGVLHLKGFIFDNTVLYSGASINNVYLGYQGKYRLDRYQVIESKPLADSMATYLQRYLIHAPAVSDLTSLEIPSPKQLSDKIATLKKNLKQSSYEFTGETIKDGCFEAIPLCGLGNVKNRLNRTIIGLMKKASNQITICTPYFNLPAHIERSITKILKRGVKLTIIVGDKIANDFYIPEDQPFNRVGAVPYLYEGFLRNFCQKHQSFINSGQMQVMLWRDGNNSFHIKGMYVDDDYYLLTGNNLNPRAWRLDFENGILLKDPNHLLKEPFQQELNEILKHASPITHWTNLDKFEDFPERIQKYLKKIFRLKLHLLIKRII